MLNSKAGIVPALWFLALVNYLDRVAMSFAGPSIMKSLHMSPAAFGVVLSSFAVGYVLAQAPGGLLADRVGAKTLLVVGPLFWAVFTGATGLVATIAGFVVVRILFGLSEGVSNSSLYKIVGENFDARQRSRTLAICSTAIPLAPAFAGALVGKLVTAFGWKVMFMALTAPALAAALLCYLLLPSGRPAAAQALSPTDPPSFRAVLGRGSLWLLSGAAFAWNIAYWGYLGWMPSYLALARHINLKAVGPIGGIPYLFAFLGLVVVGWLGSGPLHRFCGQLVVICFGGGALSLFLAYQAETLVWSLVGLSGAAFFLFGSQGPVGKIALDLAPSNYRAAYIGVYNTAGQLGGVVAPAAIGFLVTASGTFAGGFSFMVAALCVAAAAIFILAGTQRQAVAAA